MSYENNKKSGNSEFTEAVLNGFSKIVPAEMLKFFSERIEGQGDALRLAVYAVYKFLENAAIDGPAPADNWVLTAPSGCGKTEFFRVTKEYLKQMNIPIPVVQIDLSLITEEGFKGDNPTIIPMKMLLENSNCGGTAICFLDEADKKFVPSYTTYGSDVNLAVQSNLLTLTEGCDQSVVLGDEAYPYDSTKTMFVFLGAFQSLRAEKQKKEKKLSSLGFGAEFPENKDEDVFYADLDMEDFIKYGMLEELAGRITYVINFHKLSKPDMLELIYRKTGAIGKEMGIKIRLTEKGQEALLGIAFGNLGVRAPLNLIRKLARTAVSRVFFDGGFDSRCDIVEIDSLESATILHTEKRKLYTFR